MSANENSPLYSLQQIMQNANAMLVYVGSFGQDTVKSMLKYIESKLEGSGVNDLVRKKIFNVMTEMLQNITKHQQKSDSQIPGNAVFVMGETEEGYYLLTGNMAADSIEKPLSEKLSHINSLSKEELKELYKKARLESTISDVGGAGLGFIDMVRKSENPLKFSFTQQPENITFFTLQANINNVTI